MDKGDEAMKTARVVEARARNISNKVRCTECGGQSIEDSQADIAILLRQVVSYSVKHSRASKQLEEQSTSREEEQQASRFSKVKKRSESRSVKRSISKQVLRSEEEEGEAASSFREEEGVSRSRELIRDEIGSGKSDKEIFSKLRNEYGETVLYEPTFDYQTAAIWLSPVLVAGAAGGIWAYQKYRQKTNVHIMALNLVRGVPLTPNEKQTMLEVLTPPLLQRRRGKWWGL